MDIKVLDRANDEAKAIRTAIFVREKDWRPEFDEYDEPGKATHLMAFDQGRAIGVCRLFADPDQGRHPDQPGRWVIGRLAVMPEARGKGFGKALLAEAERLIAAAGGKVAALHSEDSNFPMYHHFGYAEDQLFDNGTHGWLVKTLA